MAENKRSGKWTMAKVGGIVLIVGTLLLIVCSKQEKKEQTEQEKDAWIHLKEDHKRISKEIEKEREAHGELTKEWADKQKELNDVSMKLLELETKHPDWKDTRGRDPIPQDGGKKATP